MSSPLTGKDSTRPGASLAYKPFGHFHIRAGAHQCDVQEPFFSDGGHPRPHFHIRAKIPDERVPGRYLDAIVGEVIDAVFNNFLGLGKQRQERRQEKILFHRLELRLDER
jgi:hypothetical protein